jgi:hypothetical protein
VNRISDEKLVIHGSEEEFDEVLEEKLGQGYAEDVSEELEKTPSPPFDYEEDDKIDTSNRTEDFERR